MALALVTGSSGFIGSHVCRALVERGHSVRAFHRSRSPLLALEGLALEHALGDVLDPKSLRTAMGGVDWVFHTAGRVKYWENRRGLVETTVAGTANVLEAARAAGVRRLVFTSSVSALGVPAPGELLDETHSFNYPPERFPYGHAKHLAEQEVLAATRDDLDCVIVNPGSVFGAADLNLNWGSLVIAVVRHRLRGTVRGGMNVVHVTDVAAGHLAAAERGRRGERYILGGQNLPHLEIMRVIAQETGVPPPRFELRPVLVTGAAAVIDVVNRVVSLPINGDLLRLSGYFFYCDTGKARRELGFCPARSFRQAVREAAAWYRARGYL